MAVTYEKTFEIEIINELSASVYNRVLNYVLNHDLIIGSQFIKPIKACKTCKSF